VAYTLRTGYWHSGERACPDFPEENFVNHLKAYRFASQFCSNKKVLDIGCGTGYGTSLLAHSAGSAVGIDISRQAIRYARKRYLGANVQFFQMNAESLAFPDCSFDFIISSENFEHLHDQRANLREISRVLKDEGMLLLATPNHEMFLGINTPYHTHEFLYEEFLQIVQEFFGKCLISENLLDPPTEEGQRMKKERQERGAFGINLSRDPVLWGEPVDPTWLSNTHSFFCFARKPRCPEAQGGQEA
jgi:SAM-dependent methyltransferase